uniref:Glycoside hydrolase family 5 domain-containing protein n=1 Tax=Helicotheca tamesis TaxID=374047 RepID=A0A7S2N3E9_9STRA
MAKDKMALSVKLKIFFLVQALFSKVIKGSNIGTSNTISVGGSFQKDEKSNTNNIAIGPNDIVTVKNRHLVKADGTKFLLKGIAFPDPPPRPPYDHTYNAEAWIAILHQLRDLNLKYNAIRMYRMDPYTDYSEFFNEAARLGVYILVPLTSARGGGVIDRDKSPMKCYPRSTFEYGVTSLKNYLRYPNVIAGLLGNEVMNSPQSWPSAPCVKAYGRDLRSWMKQEVAKGTIERTLPLVYAAQNTGIGPMVGPAKAMQMTMDYLTCITDEEIWERRKERLVAAQRKASEAQVKQVESTADFEDDGGTAIDIFGINVESWCSSYDTYETNVDGTPGTYHELHEGLQGSSIPLIFSEMGCAHDLYDGDLDDGGLSPELENSEGPARNVGDRTWGQVPSVLNEMSDLWSGFFAYAYDGSPQFIMFEGGPWDGKHVLEPTADFYSFKEQLDMVDALPQNGSNDTIIYHHKIEDEELPPLCHVIEQEIRDLCGIEIKDFSHIPSRVREVPRWMEYTVMVLITIILVVYGFRLLHLRQRRSLRKQYEVIV